VIIAIFERTMDNHYFVYIITNPGKTVLYTGVCNDIARRMYEHYENRGNKKTFAGRYFCYNLLFYELFNDIQYAIEREKEIKGWTRKKKEDLIAILNPDWLFYNPREL